MTEHDYYGPVTSLRSRLFGNMIQLRFIMMGTNDGEFTVDMRADSGTSDVINWLKDAGWDIDTAIPEAIKIPLVRTNVPKLRSY